MADDSRKEDGDGSLNGTKQENDEKGVRMFHPTENDKDVVDLLKELDAMLKGSAKALFNSAKNIHQNDVRQIDGNRYEVFICAPDKTIVFVDTLLERLLRRNNKALYKSVKEMKDSIIDYAKRMALCDSRIQHDFVFSTFALIISFGRTIQQQPHVDVIQPNYQFSLCLTDGAIPTLVYETPACPIQHASAVQEYIPGLTSEFTTAVADHPLATTLLQEYGLILTDPVIDTNVSTQPMKTGTLMSVPGGTIHAGPPTTEYRALIFFDGAHSPETSYNPDKQFNSGLLVCLLLIYLWTRLNVTDRTVLLWHLARKEVPRNKQLHCKLRPGLLKEFLHNFDKKRTSRKPVPAFIQRMVLHQGQVEELPPIVAAAALTQEGDAKNNDTIEKAGETQKKSKSPKVKKKGAPVAKSPTAPTQEGEMDSIAKTGRQLKSPKGSKKRAPVAKSPVVISSKRPRRFPRGVTPERT